MLDETDNEYIKKEDRVMITEKEYKEALSELTDRDKRVAKAREVVEKYKKQQLAEVKDVVKNFVEKLNATAIDDKIYIEKIGNNYLGVEGGCCHSIKRMRLVVEYSLVRDNRVDRS